MSKKKRAECSKQKGIFINAGNNNKNTLAGLFSEIIFSNRRQTVNNAT